MALIPRAYRISHLRTWTRLKSYRLSTERMASRVYTRVPQATGGEMASSLAPPLLPNLAMPPTDLLHPRPKANPFPHIQVLARLCRRSEFRTLLRALSLLERKYRRFLTFHPPRSCALRRALLTFSLPRATAASRA